MLTASVLSGSETSVAGRLNAIQWTKVPPGASGSSTKTAIDFVPGGAALHVIGGERSAPSHVKSIGIGPLTANAVLVTVRDPIVTPGGAVGCELDWQPLQAAQHSASMVDISVHAIALAISLAGTRSSAIR